ncbi:amino acid permease [Cryobacterium sp. TMT1-21]|uniref:Amino acid permease n=1 Tax=Cryobacterium shii TaxID=1259235 RepID=A0AAQ2C6H1_9MICO|nr:MULTISPECIES: amino acid permease [Cryobacterium]TFC48282.1 amino acid permease [Cryobacterium shii]TFC83805.1 amino acid permease [Cryobacterium sp. TmT2-59]TFD15448.1 amino acid permease [Cryobacterium sp. TMT1-21]TFD16659.1 amino acid permease [Cryobacterium sp. TMT4-10]TFD21882.1 amino acid permease [Cryobacterium sp. TMT2-23]
MDVSPKTDRTTTKTAGGAGELKHTLKPRHLSMIAIAGVIGAGLFVGSGAAIQQAGPGILVAYAAAGFVVILVMRMLGEMAAAHPETGSFSSYADKALGRWAGLSIGWLYAWFWIIVLGIEATAGAAIVHRWVPEIDQWVWALLLMVLLTLTNVASVKMFGEFEFWFASIKVAAIAVFLVLGVVAIVGLMPGVEAPGLSNLTGRGGFFPSGSGAVLGGVLVVVFSFFGAEIATIAAGESENPVDAVKKAVKSTVWRILVFYIGSIAVVVTLIPWDSASVAKSPYVAVIELYGIPGAGTIMDIIVLTSVLSCLNSGLYTASRMIFSLSARGDAPKSWSRVSVSGVPRGAVLASTLVGFITVGLNYLAPDTVFLYLVNTSGAIALLVWLVIAVSQLVLRRRMGAEAASRLSLKMWAFPYLTWFAIGSIVALLVGMAILERTRMELLMSLALAAVVVGIGLWKYRADKGKPHTGAPASKLPAADPAGAPERDEVAQPV